MVSPHHHGHSGHQHARGHAHGHARGHAHDHSVEHHGRTLLAVLALTVVIFLAQVIGGILSQSLALLSDSMHMLSDSTGLIIALVATMIGAKAANASATYGYRRAEVLAALANAIFVTAVSVIIVISALKRINSPAEVSHDIMIAVAVVGLVANIIAATILARRRGESLNLHGAYLHVIVDLLSSIAVIIAGIIIALTGWHSADIVASILIALLVLPRALALVAQALRVLLERVPRGIDSAAIAAALAQISGVSGVHDLHIWSIDGRELLATCHLVLVAPEQTNYAILDQAQEILRQHGVEHSTIQLEPPAHIEHEITHGDIR